MRFMVAALALLGMAVPALAHEVPDREHREGPPACWEARESRRWEAPWERGRDLRCREVRYSRRPAPVYEEDAPVRVRVAAMPLITFHIDLGR